jgi:imidazolonepropionase-like amidohydrolase
MNRPGFVPDSRRQLDIAFANLRRAAKAGVKIALGSDSGGAGGFHGPTTIREMELLAEAGLSPMDVIVAATRHAAEAIGQGQSLGTVEVGKTGDLIIVDGDPLRDISAVRNVVLVIKEGQAIDPVKLEFETRPPKQ